MQPTLTNTLEKILKTKGVPSPQEKEFFEGTQNFIHAIKWVPGIRMAAVSNSLAMYATHKNSDIDLFIITAQGRIWIVRTFVLIIATILGVRAKPGDETGKFCFPFFMTEKNLSLKEIALENDVYLAYWIQTLKPIYNQYYTYGRFMEVNQVFSESTLQYTPSAEDRANMLMNNRIFLVPTRRHPWATGIGSILSPLLSLTDSILGCISRQIIKRKIPTAGTEGIVVNNDMVKLHFTDRRRVIQERVLQDS